MTKVITTSKDEGLAFLSNLRALPLCGRLGPRQRWQWYRTPCGEVYFEYATVGDGAVYRLERLVRLQ